MEAKGSYVLVGLFVLLVGVAMIASLFWLAGWGRGTEQVYLVLMEESVSGLTVDAPVKYRGVDVGRVTSLDLRPDDPEVVQLTLSVDPSTPILVDTRAQLEFQGLTGLAFVNLIGGTRGAPRLGVKPDQEYPVIQSAPSILARLDTGVSQLLVSVTETSVRVADLLEEVDREQLANVIANLDRLTRTLADSAEGLGGAIANAERFMDSAAEVGERLPALVDEIDGLAKDWRAASVEIRAGAAAGGEGVQRMTEEVAVSAQLLTADLRRLVDRLDQVVMELEEDPSMFIYGRSVGSRGPGE
jgi:phospholipid/cholesterol/gamma-HCH transport system substrate-binding protein